MDSQEHDTRDAPAPDQEVAPEPPPVPEEDGAAAPEEALTADQIDADRPVEGSSTEQAVEPAVGPAVEQAAPASPPTRSARVRGQSRPSGRLWAAAEARRAAEAAEQGDADSDGADEAVEEAEQVVLADLAKLAAERDDYLDQLRRTKADFENYRKRILRQQTEHLERAAEALAEKLLPVLDTFDAALAHGQGFEQVHAALMTTLEKEGLERIQPEGKPFDPNESDAVAHEEGEGGPVVAEVLRPGYRWKGRVLRPAMVRVRG